MLDLANRVFGELDCTFDVPGSDLAGAAVVRKGWNEILVSSVGCKYSEQR